MQKLIEQAPDGYYSHNTGGEHAARVMGDEHKINALRTQHGLAIHEELNMFAYACENDGYVMLHEMLPDDSSGAKPELAGYILATKNGEDFGYSYVIDDLLVDQKLRGRDLGKFLVGKLANKGEYGGGAIRHASSLSVDSSRVTSEAMSWLLSRGFGQRDNGQLKLALPGTIFSFVSPAQHEKLQKKMPKTWNGCIESDESPMTFVYRSGQEVGHVTRLTRLEADPYFFEGQDNIAMRFRLQSSSGAVAEGIFSSEFFAITALLNGAV